MRADSESPATLRSRATPDLPLTVEDYREREAFLLELLALARTIEDAEGEAARHRRQLMQLYSAINGGGVRQGTLHPPTATQREQLDRIRTALRRLGLVAAQPFGNRMRKTSR